MTWQESVLSAVRRMTKNSDSRVFTRQQLIDSELTRIVREVRSTGETPDQTLSRVLQKLRDEGVIEFVSDDVYRLSH